MAKVTGIVEQARSRISDWQINRGGWSAISKGLRKGYKRCQRAAVASAADATVENLHEWRKQAKYFWHELQLIEPSNPDVRGPMADTVHELTKRLGDDHDLAVLKQTVVQNPEQYGGVPVIERMLPVLEPRRAQLQKEAFELQRQTFSEPQELFLKRLRSYWRAWHNAR